MTTAYRNFLAALDSAGYVHDARLDVYVTVVETARTFVFMQETFEGLLVGVFHKATATKRADYEGQPRYEGDDRAVALAVLRASIEVV